ncbi:Hypothetical protein NTJ_00948 [Nesidiocoris tenuis]|uniref:Uncharacterized protein n=1 Tax=Nesidiocoris tenuis TaxID=355587 RepID=A0ABN7A820_9HEMI|nr:Hypothetical protein NTJ_00948 [Nesidiocoris tenuis]
MKKTPPHMFRLFLYAQNRFPRRSFDNKNNVTRTFSLFRNDNHKMSKEARIGKENETLPQIRICQKLSSYRRSEESAIGIRRTQVNPEG